jgi:hypothetical protein
LIPILILAGLGYWRYSANKAAPVSPVSSDTSTVDQTPVEVPKTLPNATLEDRVKALEDLITKLATQLNVLKVQSSQSVSPIPSDSKVSDLDASITELKARVSALEKVTPGVAALSSQSTIYIPIGSATGPWTNTDWSILGEYEISLDPSSYPSYTGMNLEVNFRLVDPTGTGSVRLYNTTDSSVVSSQLDTVSTSFSLKSSAAFKLAGGQKTYKLQVKSSGGKELYIQSARIKVNF